MIQKSTQEPDVVIENHGSLMLFHLSESARDWVDENVSDDHQFYGNALVVEPRYAFDLAQGMIDAGLEVR